MTDVPAVVTSALAQRDAARTPEAHGSVVPTRVLEGDLRVIESLPHRPTDHRIGLVLRVNSADEFAEVLLVHATPELATDRDIILPSEVTSAPYDAVVQTDLRGAVWTLQIGGRVGRLSELALAAAKATDNSPMAGDFLAALSTQMPELPTGIPLAGPLDRRWSFKESEGAALRALATDCTETLLDQGIVWEVNPGLLKLELLDLADDPELLLIELMHWAQTRSLSLTDDDLEQLRAAGALDVDTWLQFSDLGADLLMGLEQVLQPATTGVSFEAQTEDRCLLTASHLDATDQEVPHDRTHYLAAKEPVAA